MSPAELAVGFSTYTNTEELRVEIVRAGGPAPEPTTTVLTTSRFCG
jgi:hypothetical protein